MNPNYPDIALAGGGQRRRAAFINLLSGHYGYVIAVDHGARNPREPHVTEIFNVDDYWQRRGQGYKVVRLTTGLYEPDPVVDAEIWETDMDDAWDHFQSYLRRWAR